MTWRGYRTLRLRTRGAGLSCVNSFSSAMPTAVSHAERPGDWSAITASRFFLAAIGGASRTVNRFAEGVISRRPESNESSRMPSATPGGGSHATFWTPLFDQVWRC